MALLHFNFESQYLNGNTDISVILPERPRKVDAADFYSNGKRYKVLWLLHGTYGDYTDWVRRTNIETYACENDLIVVMPSALNSDYASWPKFACGYDMERYLVDELMPLVYHWLPASDKREDNFIAGLSMGAQGAARYAVWYPEKFAGVAILSGSPHDWRRSNLKGAFAARTQNQLDAEGGLEGLLHSHRNIWDRIDALAKTGSLPRMYVASGTADFLFQDWYVPFKNHAKEIGLDATFEELEGYGHEWRFWDITIQRTLRYFGFQSRDGGNAF